jgi:hypothetical protein
MSNARTVVAVAREIIARHGVESAAITEKRAEENACVGDREAAAFWRRVTQAVRALEQHDPAKLLPVFEKITLSGNHAVSAGSGSDGDSAPTSEISFVRSLPVAFRTKV